MAKLDYDKISKELDRRDKVREYVIVESRKILKASKKAISMCHNDNLKGAKKELDEAEKVKKDIQ